MSELNEKKASLYLVLGGELKNLESHEFRDLNKVNLVGVFSDYKTAEASWRSNAQATVDNALERYFIVDLPRFLEPK